MTSYSMGFYEVLLDLLYIDIWCYLLTGIAFHYINPPVVAYIPQFNLLLILITAYSKLSTSNTP